MRKYRYETIEIEVSTLDVKRVKSDQAPSRGVIARVIRRELKRRGLNFHRIYVGIRGGGYTRKKEEHVISIVDEGRFLPDTVISANGAKINVLDRYGPYVDSTGYRWGRWNSEGKFTKEGIDFLIAHVRKNPTFKVKLPVEKL